MINAPNIQDLLNVAKPTMDTKGALEAYARKAKDDPEALKKAAAEFEAIFINQMLKTMRDTIDKSGFMDGGSGEEMYRSMLDTELSRTVAQSGGIGIARMLVEQMESAGMIEKEEPSLVNAIIREAQRQAPQKAVIPSSGALNPVAIANPAIAASYEPQAKKPQVPVQGGRVSSDYGTRKDPFTGEDRFHHGLDIAVSEGTPIYPARPGTVIFSGEKGGYGNVVEVLHDDGLKTIYAHTQKNLVKQGDRVDVNEVIAHVGSTGRSTGPHLHFEVVADGRSFDPEKFLYG